MAPISDQEAYERLYSALLALKGEHNFLDSARAAIVSIQMALIVHMDKLPPPPNATAERSQS